MLSPLGKASCQDPKTIQKVCLVLIKGVESLGRRPGKDLTDKLFLNGVDFIRFGSTQGQILWKLTDKPTWISTYFGSGNKH